MTDAGSEFQRDGAEAAHRKDNSALHCTHCIICNVLQCSYIALVLEFYVFCHTLLFLLPCAFFRIRSSYMYLCSD